MNKRERILIVDSGETKKEKEAEMNRRESTLVVDDGDDTGRNLALMRGRKGYETETARIVREALEKAPGDFFNQLEAQNEKLRLFLKLVAQKQELMEKNRELELASQAKSEFLASVSHELRTPINAIMGFTELMLDGIPGDINDEQRQCLGNILSSSRHLLHLISEVFDLAKVEAGKTELKLENLAPAEL